MKTWALGLALAASLASGAAQAATVSGTFTIDIYNFNSGGTQSNADATAANIGLHSADKVATVTYTGALDFSSNNQASNPTIESFLNSAAPGGSYTVNSGSLSSLLSSGNFQATTLFDIKAVAFNAIVDGTGKVTHDDGFSFYDDNVLDAGSFPSPTTARTDNFAFNSGNFRLIYASANGDPSILNVQGTVVPLPATALLLLTALAGLSIGTGMRKKT